MNWDAVLGHVPGLDRLEVTRWIERRWVRPEGAASDVDVAEVDFAEVDAARIRLIHELRTDLAVADDSIDLVLSLIDQIHDLRCRLRLVLRAVDCQPADVQAAVLAALEPPRD